MPKESPSKVTLVAYQLSWLDPTEEVSSESLEILLAVVAELIRSAVAILIFFHCVLSVSDDDPSE